MHRKATISSSAASNVQCCSSFVHCGLAGCDVQARLVSRSCGSFQPSRPAHRRRRHRTCHDGPRLRLPYASTSASPTFADLLLFLNGASMAARRRTRRAVGPGSGRRGAGRRNRWRHILGVGNARVGRPREQIRGGVTRCHRIAVPACGRCVAVAGRDLGFPRPDCPSCAGPLVFWPGYRRYVREAGCGAGPTRAVSPATSRRG